MYNESKIRLAILASLILLAVAATSIGVSIDPLQLGQGFVESLKLHLENNTSSISMNNTTNATTPSNVNGTLPGAGFMQSLWENNTSR
jgi:hypothetical protein